MANPASWKKSGCRCRSSVAFTEGDTGGWGDLLYPMLAERCDVHVTRAVDEIGFGTLTAAQARALQLSPRPPVRRRHAPGDLGARPAQLRTTRGDAHAFHYTITIT